jgi:serine/threonine protein kinase
MKDLEILNLIGKGAFGKVYLVKLKLTGKLLALKAISKSKLKES